MDFITKWFNIPLMSQPLNWLIVGTIASIWLLAFHSLVTGFTAMAAPGGAIGAAPGQVATPVGSGLIGGAPLQASDPFSPYLGSMSQVWTDGYESKYAEDGSTYNF